MFTYFFSRIPNSKLTGANLNQTNWPNWFSENDNDLNNGKKSKLRVADDLDEGESGYNECSVLEEADFQNYSKRFDCSWFVFAFKSNN